MDSKDELLAKLRAIDAEPPAAEPGLKAVSPPMATPASTARTEAQGPDISTDEFLAQLAALDEATRPASSPLSNRHVTAVQSQSSSQSPAPSPPVATTATTTNQAGEPATRSPATRSPATSPKSAPPRFPNVIERLKQFTQAQLAAHAAENRAKAKRQKEIERAQAWLNQLDPLSDDGFWFEQFAERYESRIEAALVFLNPGASQSETPQP